MEDMILTKVNFKSDSETDLIQAAVRGDHRAFIELLMLHKSYLYRTAFVYVKDDHKAQEILQECSYNAFLNISKLRNPAYFKTWITRILINASLVSIKQTNNLVHLEDDSVLVSEGDTLSLEEKLDLYNAIDLLREKYKTVILLKYFNDLPIEDIAKIMDIPQNTVKTYLKRAKESLARILKEDYLYE